jgi:uncharacterized protein (TIGR02246 family)
MKTTATVAVCVLSLALTASRSDGAQMDARDAEERVREVEAIWNQAHLRGDADALDKIWAPGLTVIVPGMQPFSKEDLLRMWRSMKITFMRYETSDVQVRVVGDAAIVTGRLRRSRNFGGQVKEEDWLFTKTYTFVEGVWKVAAYHASATPEP